MPKKRRFAPVNKTSPVLSILFHVIVFRMLTAKLCKAGSKKRIKPEVYKIPFPGGRGGGNKFKFFCEEGHQLKLSKGLGEKRSFKFLEQYICTVNTSRLNIKNIPPLEAILPDRIYFVTTLI